MPARFLGAIAAVALLAAGSWAWFGLPGQSSQPGKGTAPPASVAKRSASGAGAAAVEVAVVRARKASDDIRTVGSLHSDESVQLAAEIAGRITEIAFQEGTAVRRGDVLVRFDDALARAEVQQARARLTLAEANSQRAETLSRTGNVTDRARDEATAALLTAQAELELAETRLEKHDVRAPFDGIVGIRSFSVGAYLAPGAAIVNLESLATLKVDFRVPETYLATVKTGQTVEVRADAIPDRVFTGVVYAINPLVDVNGRSIQLRGRIDNSAGVLRPGLFARIALRGSAERELVSVPESAIVPRGGDTFVFLVEGDRASERRVRLGQRSSGTVEVVEGLEAGSRIVVAGQQRLRDGMRVEIVPAVVPLPVNESAMRRSG